MKHIKTYEMITNLGSFDFKQILLVSTKGNVWRRVLRLWILMLWLKVDLILILSSLLASFSWLLQTDMAGCFHSKTEVSLHVSYVSLLYCSWHAVLSIWRCFRCWTLKRIWQLTYTRWDCCSFNSYEGPRQNFSWQCHWNIKQTFDEN